MDVNSKVDPSGGFLVDDVERATEPLLLQNWEETVSSRLQGMCNVAEKDVDSSTKGKNESQGTLEAVSKLKDGVNAVNTAGWGEKTHGLIKAIHLAYSYHYPLVITPDDIWLCIVQGFATHVNKNSEKLRHHLVEFEGKKTISVRRDDFVLGSRLNPWHEIFSEFSSKIRQHIGEKTHDLLVPTFTTTGQTEKAAAEIVLMESLKKYLDYRLMTMCGIPEVQLKGTVEDWKQLRERALGLGQFELEWWTEKSLKPVLDELVATSEGRINKEFWGSIYKRFNESGGPYVSGWILKLFPYVKLSAPWWDQDMKVATTDKLPSGLSAVPFVWEYLDSNIDMEFFAGFMGVAQDPRTLSVSSAIGWAVTRQPVTDQKANSKKCLVS